jgi:hypothetical protein
MHLRTFYRKGNSENLKWQNRSGIIVLHSFKVRGDYVKNLQCEKRALDLANHFAREVLVFS